jgi:hypothetical protein
LVVSITSSSSGTMPSSSAARISVTSSTGEHVAAAHHLGTDAIDDQAHRQAAFVQFADHAVGVADRADFRRRDDDRFARAGERVAEAVLDAGRTVDEHVVAELEPAVRSRRPSALR